jgi:hypothetical protein
MNALLIAVRRRVRVVRAVALLQHALPLAAAVGLLLVALGRVRPLSWPEPAALVLGVAVAVGVAVWGVVASVPLRAAARVTDRSLGTHDAFVTALELGGRTDDFAMRVAQRATSLSLGRTAKEALPVPRHWWRLIAAVVIVAAAAALAIAPNHQDDIRRQRAAEVAAVRNEAEKLREQAATIAQRGDAESTALADQLRALAQELERSSSKNDALAALDEEIGRLQATLNPVGLAR